MKTRIQGIIIVLLIGFSANAQEVRYLDDSNKKSSKRKATQKLIIEEIAGDKEHEKLTLISLPGDRKIFEGVFLKEEDYTNFIKDGYYKEFYYYSSIKSKENYSNNIREGEAIEYFNNGQIRLRYTNVNNKKVGTETEYTSNGILVRKSNYNVKKSGEEFIYYKSGTIKEKNIYKNGSLEGECQSFFESGKLKSEQTYRLDTLHGESRTYFGTGGLHTKYNYLDDKRHGDFEEYYETGELESSGKMNSGKKHGEFNSFYKSGVKRRYEYYAHGKENKELGKCFATDGSDTTYFPRIIMPLVNNRPFDKEIVRIIQNNFEYPIIAREMGIEGTIYISFVFTKDDRIDDIKVANPEPYNYVMSQEALRLVRLIGNEDIKHGFFEGKPGSIEYTIPIRFKII